MQGRERELVSDFFDQFVKRLLLHFLVPDLQFSAALELQGRIFLQDRRRPVVHHVIKQLLQHVLPHLHFVDSLELL